MHEYNEKGEPVCSMCKRHTSDLSLEPSRKQLIFGGFNVRLEYRCGACEKKVIKSMEATLRGLSASIK